MSLRVLHLNSLLRGGGTDDQCVKLAAGLRALGIDAMVAGPDEREFSWTVRKLGVPMFATPPEGFLKLRLIREVAEYIRSKKIHIVHSHHGRDIWPTILAARWSGVRPKVVLTRHLAKSPASWFSRRFMLNRCDAVIAVSDFVARVLREGVYQPGAYIPERRVRPPIRGDRRRIHVIPGGIDTTRFRPGAAEELRAQWRLQPGHFAFAAVGAYDLPHGKGQRVFLRAAAKIHRRIPDARFLIVGRGNMAGALQTDIARHDMEHKAWLTPYCQDMPAAMNAIDCLVHAQVGTEAFGAVVIEAFACGRPVIASSLDGIPEAFAVGGVGTLVRPRSSDELAEAMLAWAQRPRLTEAERQALHARVSRDYSLTAFARRVAGLYEHLLPAPDVDEPAS